MVELPYTMRLSQKMRLYHPKMMMPHIMELLSTMRLPHTIRVAKKMLQDETSSIDKASSNDEAA